MTERSGEQPVDLAAIQADDALLDALGRGEPAPDDDDLAGLLADWRADLDAGAADVVVPVAAPTRLAAPARRGTGLRRVLGGAVAAAVLLGGATLGAHESGPGSPLWPLTRVLYPQEAHVRAAEQSIAMAQDAAAAGRFDEARRLLDTAAGEAEQVDAPATRQRLLDRIAEIRRSLPTASVPAPPASPPPVTSTAPTPGTTAQQTPGAGGGNTTGPGGVVPGLPTAPAPSVSVPGLPLPTVPLPTTLLPPLPGG